MPLDAELDRIREFVAAFDAVVDLQFAGVPYDLRSHEGIGYLLLDASINQGASAEFIRDLMGTLHAALGDDLLAFHTVGADGRAVGNEYISQHLPRWMLARDWADNLSAYAAMVTSSASASPHGLTLRQVGRKPAADVVEGLAVHSCRPGRGMFMGKSDSARKRLWMFMRWVVRGAPDLGVWTHVVSPAELIVPLDVNTGRAFQALQVGNVGAELARRGLTVTVTGDRVDSTLANAEVVTALARLLFPEDPARVDYAFFSFGRRQKAKADTCWTVVSCPACPIRTLVNCPGYGPRR